MNTFLFQVLRLKQIKYCIVNYFEQIKEEEEEEDEEKSGFASFLLVWKKVVRILDQHDVRDA